MVAKDFADAFLGKLARGDFHNVGALDQYLALPEANRTGDEANVVDFRVTQALLEALGYATAEIDYNAGKNNLRPDFVVRIAEYPGCCFVVEDKATTESLSSHRPQLASYMAANRCPRGLLINGSRILGFDDAGIASSASLDFSIVNAIQLWRGATPLSGNKEGWDALHQSDQEALAVISRRYGKEAYSSVTALLDDLTLDRDGNPHAEDGSTWVPGQTRLMLVNANEQPDQLVEAVQALIGELCEDVAVQYAVHQSDYIVFLKETERAPGSTAPAINLMNSIADDLLSLVPVAAETRRDMMRSRLRQAMSGARPESEIDEVIAEIREIIGAKENTSAPDALSRAGAKAKSFATRYGRHVTRAREQHSMALKAIESHDRWQTAVGTLLLAGMDIEKIKAEYFAQTAYLVIIRMLLVRVLEDKKLTPRVFTNGGASLWFRHVEPHYFSLAMGRSAGRLLEIAYENAQATYAHFYDDHRVFDWYVPDRIMVVRVLHRLAGFDLSAIDRDIIGTVYGRFVNDRHKHEQGMYYTPTKVVSFILDRVGWNGATTVGASLLDPACGSGAFLVEAARRVIDANRAQALAEGKSEIPPERVQAVLDSIRQGLIGFDLNPFACALAEINLLVQVLDLVAHAHNHGHPARLDRFRVFTTDALRVLPGARAALEAGLDRSEAADLPEEEQAKVKLGIFADGFDAVVGNPPYVRADEGASGLLEYRDIIKKHPLPSVQGVLKMKWDLFVPFVALGASLLRFPGGKLGMIVSNGLETVPYAQALREQLATAALVQEVHFFEPIVKLFDDAQVRNTIFIAEAGAPTALDETVRQWHKAAPPASHLQQRLPQVTYGAEVFRSSLPTHRIPTQINAELLKHVCYVSVGMVLNANEKRDKKIHPETFQLDDLLSDLPDGIHTKPYVGSEDLRITNSVAGEFLFAPSRIKYLEYDTYRVPALVRRPTFRELYDREKIMVGEFGGAVHDNGTFNSLGFLTCNHSVFLFLPWHLLAGVQNRSLKDREREVGRLRNDLEQSSLGYPLPFLVGLFNSTIWDKILLGRASTSISGRAQPNNFADQPIPLPGPTLADAVGQCSDAARVEGLELGALIAAGWQRLPNGWNAAPLLLPNTQQVPFAVACTRWGITIERPTARCDNLRREGSEILSGKGLAARFPAALSPDAVDFLLRLLRKQGNLTLEAVEKAGLPTPLRPAEAAKAEQSLVQQQLIARGREDAILGHRAKIDGLLAPLFETITHPSIEVVNP